MGRLRSARRLLADQCGLSLKTFRGLGLDVITEHNVPRFVLMSEDARRVLLNSLHWPGEVKHLPMVERFIDAANTNCQHWCPTHQDYFDCGFAPKVCPMPHEVDCKECANDHEQAYGNQSLEF